MSNNNSNNTLLIILGGVGVFAVCIFGCCGFFMYQGYNAAQQMQKSMLKLAELHSSDPKDIHNATDEITEINIPVIFSPETREKMTMSDFDENDIKGIGDFEKMAEGPYCVKVTYTGDGSYLTTLEIAGFVDPPYTEADKKEQTKFLKDQLEYSYNEIGKVREQLKKQMEDQLETNTKPPQKDTIKKDDEEKPDDSKIKYNGHSVEKLEREIRGEKVTLNLHSEGGESAEAPNYWILEGTFPGKHAPAKILLRVESENMTHDDIVRMVDSIE